MLQLKPPLQCRTDTANSYSTYNLTGQGEWMHVRLEGKRNGDGEKYNVPWVKCKFPQYMSPSSPPKSTNFYQIFPEPHLILSSPPCLSLWRPCTFAHIPVFICCVCAFYFSKLIDESDVFYYFIFWRSFPAKTLWKIAVCIFNSHAAGCPMELEPCDFLHLPKQNMLYVRQRCQIHSENKDNYNF